MDWITVAFFLLYSVRHTWVRWKGSANTYHLNLIWEPLFCMQAI